MMARKIEVLARGTQEPVETANVPMPGFSLMEYRAFLEAALEAGVVIEPVELMPKWDGRQRTLYLRHDIDLHIPGIERMAQVEASLGVSASYFVPLTLHFNPAYPPNRDVLRSLLDAGHRIGLHYDLQTYPWDVDAIWPHLDAEVARLGEIVGVAVESICMHHPRGGRCEDVLRDSDRYVHPHAQAFRDVVYVSDSCRAWRDENLLGVLDPCGPLRLLLNTHPELWLGEAEEDRYSFLRGRLQHNTVVQHSRYVLDYVEPTWRRHPGPHLHDARSSR
jgi:hypothetical protein